jgi:hypothetical protein
MKPSHTNFLTFILLLMVVPPLSSQVLYDTVSIRSVGPGMMHYHVIAPAIPWNIDVLRVDLTNPHIHLETVKANDRLAGHEQVSLMAARKGGPGRTVVGGVNGDFYGGTGIPTNIQIAQGEILLKPVTRPAIGFTAGNSPLIDIVTMSVTALIGDTVATVHGVNTSRQTNQMILFNSYTGSSTGTNSFGTEALIRPITPWVVNDTVVCIAESLHVGAGNMTIPRGWAVLSAHGTSETALLSRIQAGDTLRLLQNITPGLPRLKEMVGGNPKLISGGVDVSPAAPREPRTAAGFSADSTLLYLVTVDGRQGNLSVGMTFTELAQFMRQIGVHEGINLDGGGSTTMVIRDSIMNSPSDGGERAVSNGLLVISSAPVGSLQTVSISPKNARIFRGSSRQFHAFAADEYGNPASINPGLARFSCNVHIGTIDSLTGVFSAAGAPAEGYVLLRYGSHADSARIVVKQVGTLHLSPRSIVTDTARSINFTAESFDIDDLRQEVPPDAYQWTSSNPATGIVGTTGVFTPLASGTTNVVAAIDGLSDTATVRVELGEGYRILDSLQSLSGWTISAAQVDSFSTTIVDSVSAMGGASLKIDYHFTGSANIISYLYLDRRMPVFGVPDSVIINARTDNHAHRIYYVIEDDDGEEFRLYSSRLLNRIGILDTIRAPLFPLQEITPGARFHYPIVIKRIEVQLVYNRQQGAPYQGTLFLDNLRVSYPQKLITTVEPASHSVPDDFQLYQNYPNPFNPTTTIRFAVPAEAYVTLRVYDMLGREIAHLVDENLPAGMHTVTFDAQGLSSGIYISVITSGGRRVANKMMLVK